MKKIAESLFFLFLTAFSSSSFAQTPNQPKGITQKVVSLGSKVAVDGAIAPFDQTVEYTDVDLNKSMKPKVIILLDSSGSMGQMLDQHKSKMWWSKKLFKAYMNDQWREKADVGLVVYGSRRKKDCGDYYMPVKPEERNLSKIEKVVEGFEPTGMTPIADSLEMAINELKNYPGPKRIMIFTDGEETCGGNSCKLLEDAIQNKIFDLEMFVTGIGMKAESKDLDGLRCLGKVYGAPDPKSLNQALNDVHNASHGGPKGIGSNNLFVVAPIPNATVKLYRLVNGAPEFVRDFIASNGVMVPPGDYRAEVLLDPIYKFEKFTIPAKKRVTLKVEGAGSLTVKYFGQFLDVQVLNKDKKAVYTGTSDQPIRVKSGVYDVRISAAPFFERVESRVKISPGGSHEIPVEGIGVLQMEYPSTVGLYVYNSSDTLIGNYVTNSPFMLKTGTYRIFVNENCNVPNVQVNNDHLIKVLTCGKK